MLVYNINLRMVEDIVVKGVYVSIIKRESCQYATNQLMTTEKAFLNLLKQNWSISYDV